jgi:hypothetical protein
MKTLLTLSLNMQDQQKAKLTLAQNFIYTDALLAWNLNGNNVIKHKSPLTPQHIVLYE